MGHLSEANRERLLPAHGGSQRNSAGGEHHANETAYAMLERFRADRATLMRKWLSREYRLQSEARLAAVNLSRGGTTRERLIHCQRLIRVAKQRRAASDRDLKRRWAAHDADVRQLGTSVRSLRAVLTMRARKG